MTPGSDTTLPGISVIVITLNEERTIRGCLDSLVALDYPADSLEIIVVDASSDATPAIAAGYPGVRVERSAKGFATQKNAGLALVRHGIVAFTDADCVVPAGWLRTIARGLARPEVTGIGGNAFPPPDTGFFGRCVAAVGHPGGGSVGFDANVTPERPGGIEFVAGCNGAFHREALLGVGGFDPAFDRGGEDVDISRRLQQAGGRLEFVPDMNVYHAPHVPFGAYARWNLRVGASKFALERPGLARLLLDPRFPLWSALSIAALVALALWRPAAAFAGALLGWATWLGIVYLTARPFPLLLRRRAQARLPLWAVLTVVPFLVWVRQVAINVGEIAEWRRHRRPSA